MSLEAGDHVHFVGIGGIGMSAVARALMALGHGVSGSDVHASALTAAVAAEGARVFIGHRAEHVEGADVVVTSSAVPQDNVEVLAARRAGLRVLHRSEALGYVVDRHDRCFGVLGTHGKGTVVTMITRALEHAGLRPSFVVGGLALDYGRTNARVVRGSPCVVEIDESDGSHANVRAGTMVLNNLEADHLNFYGNLEELRRSMVAAFRDNPRLRRVVVNAGSPTARQIIPDVCAPVVTFGFVPEVADSRPTYAARAVVLGPSGGAFTLFEGGEALGQVTIPLPGRHNLENALAAAALSLSAGADDASVASVLREFPGLEHRLEFVRERDGVTYINDSKGTNVGAVIKSVEGFTRPVILIAGGYDKGSDFSPLYDPFRQRVKLLVLIGKAADKMAKAVGSATETVFAKTLQDAVRLSSERATQGDVVLLSPACASFDMFRDFEDRGRQFKEAVLALPGCRLGKAF